MPNSISPQLPSFAACNSMYVSDSGKCTFTLQTLLGLKNERRESLGNGIQCHNFLYKVTLILVVQLKLNKTYACHIHLHLIVVQTKTSFRVWGHQTLSEGASTYRRHTWIWNLLRFSNCCRKEKEQRHQAMCRFLKTEQTNLQVYIWFAQHRRSLLSLDRVKVALNYGPQVWLLKWRWRRKTHVKLLLWH